VRYLIERELYVIVVRYLIERELYVIVVRYLIERELPFKRRANLISELPSTHNCTSVAM
jgi:hypothetical protein